MSTRRRELLRGIGAGAVVGILGLSETGTVRAIAAETGTETERVFVHPEGGLVGEVLGDDGSGSYGALVARIDWCMSNDIELISMSLGGDSDSDTVDQAVEEAHAAGHLLLCATGDEGNEGDDSCAESADCERPDDRHGDREHRDEDDPQFAGEERRNDRFRIHTRPCEPSVINAADIGP